MDTPADATPATILIVDDEHPVRRTLQTVLEKNGLVCHSAADGQQGLACLRAADYDVAFIDMRMPKLDGMGLLAAMREARLNTVPIVLTGFGEVSSAVEAMKLGAFDFLTKPPDFTDLVRAASRAIEHSRARRHGRIMEHLAAEWQITFDACPDLIAIVDTEERCLRCNRAMASRLNVEVDQFRGSLLFEVLNSSSKREQQALFHRTLSSGAVQTGEWHDDRLGGDFLVNMAPLRDAAGKLFGVVYIAQDITKRKQAEVARDQMLLREQQARLEAEVTKGRFAFLAQASTLLASSLDYRATLTQVVKLAAPFLADVCLLDLVEADDSMHRLAAGGVALSSFSLDPESPHPIALVVRNGQPLIANHIPVAQLLASAALPSAGPLPCMIVPLPGRNKTLGAFTFMSDNPAHQFLPADLILAEDLARRAANAIELARLFEETQRHEQELRALASQLSSAEDRERRRLALSIHDSLGQNLSVVKLNLEALLRGTKSPRPQTARPKSTKVLEGQKDEQLEAPDRLAESLRVMNQLIDQARSLTFDLYPAMLDDLGLVPTLRWYSKKYSAQTGIRVEVSEAGNSVPLPTPIVNFLFRAIKELLHNVAKHAGAKEVVLGVHWKTDRIRVVVADDGRGMPARDEGRGARDEKGTLSSLPSPGSPIPSTGLGLLAIRERIASLGGEFLLESWPDRGTQVILEVPVESNESPS